MFSKTNNTNKKRGQGIVRVSDLFSKYTKLLKPPQKTVVRATIAIINELYGISITEEQCVYQTSSKTLTLHVPGPLKSEIVLNKKNILEKIGESIGSSNAPKNIL